MWSKVVNKNITLKLNCIYVTLGLWSIQELQYIHIHFCYLFLCFFFRVKPKKTNNIFPII